MHRETSHGVRRIRSLVMLLILVVAIAISAALVTANANALPTFTTGSGTIPACATCHDKAGTHSKAGHAAVYPTCSNCHVNGDTSVPPTPAKCGVCHGQVAVILTSAQHVTTGCGTTAGCHGVPSPTPTVTAVATTASLKVAPTTIKLRKTVKATGAVTPAVTLAGKKVALKAEMKKGTKWVKAKTGSVTLSATGTYKWTYKPLKKGSYRVTARIAATSTYKACKSKVRTFKVK